MNNYPNLFHNEYQLEDQLLKKELLTDENDSREGEDEGNFFKIIFQKVKEIEEDQRTTTMEGVINVALAERLIYPTPPCILILKQNTTCKVPDQAKEEVDQRKKSEIL